MLELWEMWSTRSFPLLPGPLWPVVVAPDRVLSIGQIEEIDIKTLYFNMKTKCKQIVKA